MADSVRVQFSASIGALIKGVEDAKSAIKSVKASTDKVTEGAKQLLETFGLAFSVDKISEFVGQMAEMGEQVERSSAILGTSTKSVQELGFIAKATGGDADGLALAMERLQVNLQKAQAGAGPAYQALKALGLSAKELSALPLDAQLNRIADAFAKFADGPNKTAIAIELLGRAGAQMIPVLDQGSAGLARLREDAVSTGAVMSKDTVTALSALEKAFVGLKASVTGVSGSIVGEFAPALTRAATGTAQLIGDVNIAIQSHTVWEREMIGLATGARELGQALLNMGTIAKDVFTLNWGAIAADRQAGLDKVAYIEMLGQNKIYEIAKEARTAYEKLLAGTEEGIAKLQAPTSGAPNRSDISAQLQQFETQIKLADAAYKQTQEQLGAEVKLHQITYDQETQLLLAALDKRHSAELAALDAEQAVGGLTTAQYQKIIDERKLIDQKYAADHQKIINQTAEQDVKAWESALTPLQSAFNSQIRRLLAGTETWGQAMKAIFADLVLDGIKWLEKLAVEKAAAGLTSLVGGGPSSLLGLGGGGQAAGTAALETGALTLQTGSATLLTAAGTLQVAAGTMAAGSAAGPLDLLKFTLPFFDTGSWSVPGDMAAVVHQGEMIVPNDGSASTLRSMLSGGGPSIGGGGNFTFAPNLSAFNPAGLQQLINNMMPQLMRAINSYQTLNPSTR